MKSKDGHLNQGEVERLINLSQMPLRFPVLHALTQTNAKSSMDALKNSEEHLINRSCQALWYDQQLLK